MIAKSAAEVAAALGHLYKRGPLKWPRLMQVDPGREFFGAASQLLATHKLLVRSGVAENHRQQGIVERFNPRSGYLAISMLKRCCFQHAGLLIDLLNGWQITGHYQGTERRANEINWKEAFNRHKGQIGDTKAINARYYSRTSYSRP